MKRILSFTIIIVCTLIMSCSERAIVYLSGIEIDRQSVSIKPGETLSLSVTPFPAEADLGELYWESSDTGVVSVDSEGKITAISSGEATVTVSSGDIANICLVTVVDMPVSTIKLSQTSVEMTKGDAVNIEAEAISEMASDREYVWASSDEDIVVVSAFGNVATIMGMNSGEAVVEVECGGCSTQCLVKVNGIPVEQILVMPVETELLEGETAQILAEVLPENAEYDGVKWTSSDTEVVSVDVTGMVTAIAPGVATITVSAGGVSSECSVKVNKKTANIGDYYYSDGSWSTELDESKTPIGIVFYVGDPGVHDAALRAEHPECTNGLAVALNGDALSSWQSGYEDYASAYPDYQYKVGDWIEDNTEYVTTYSDDNGKEPDYLNKIMGYNNTKGLEAFNADPGNSRWQIDVIQKVVEYREQVNAPKSSSDWYLPSAKELSLLCSGVYDENISDIVPSLGLTKNRDFINSRLETVQGAVKFTNFMYLSSTEKRFQAYTVHFFFGTVGSIYKDAVNPRYRFVLAF